MGLEDIPRVNWPEHSGFCGVVQININGESYLRCGKYNDERHRDILRGILEKVGIQYGEIYSGGIKIPCVMGERYEVVGMGNLRLRLERGIARFFGKSHDYGLRIDKKHLMNLLGEVDHGLKIELYSRF